MKILRESLRNLLVFLSWILRKIVVPVLAGVGGLVVILLLFFVFAVGSGIPSALPIPAQVVLEVNLERRLAEYVPQDPIAQALKVTEKTLTLRDVTDALDRAADDERVVGLVAKVGAPMGLASLQEIRDTVQRFSESGKFTIAYAETFGEFGPGTGAYYLASAFNDIYLQPSGILGLTGLTFESPFLRGTFDKLHIEPRIFQREEYKNAADMFTRRQYSSAHREAMQMMMGSQFEQIVNGIADRRAISPVLVRQLMEEAPFVAVEAVDHGFVDSLLYRDEVYAEVESRSDGAARLYLRKYLQRAGRPHTYGPTIALIYGIGPVHRGVSEFDPFDNSSSMGSSTISAAFRNAVRDDDVRAILFRVNSPGGSYVASDLIWREMREAHEAGKPVIVSMGDVAASGGYLVSVAADRIVAQPGTITGSIGVLAGKLITREFWREHVGVTWDAVSTSESSKLWSSLDEYSPDHLAQVNGLLDHIYDEFTGKVAVGRNMELDAVISLAKGRVWTGQAAATHGLADTLGGFDLALRLARTAAGLADDSPVTVTVYPREKEPIEAIVEQFLDQGPDHSDDAQVAVVQHVLDAVRPLYRLAVRAGLIGREGGVVHMIPMDIVW